MNPDINQELLTFGIALISGVLCSMIFDFFRAMRAGAAAESALVGLTDIIFWIFSCAACFACIYYTGGELRFYIFAAIIIGSFLYFLTLSRLVSGIFVNFFKIIRFILKILLTPVRFLYKILIRVTYFFKCKCGRINEYCKNIRKNKKFGKNIKNQIFL